MLRYLISTDTAHMEASLSSAKLSRWTRVILRLTRKTTTTHLAQVRMALIFGHFDAIFGLVIRCFENVSGTEHRVGLNLNSLRVHR